MNDRTLPARILFVCLGNICRSPLAEGIATHLAALGRRNGRMRIESAGTGGWHIGDPPDRRSIAVAASHGIDIVRQKARKVAIADFTSFDLILGMDRANVASLEALAPANVTARIALFLHEAHGDIADIPDPYHGGAREFEAVYSMIFDGCTALFDRDDAVAS